MKRFIKNLSKTKKKLYYQKVSSYKGTDYYSGRLVLSPTELEEVLGISRLDGPDAQYVDVICDTENNQIIIKKSSVVLTDTTL